MGTFQGGIGNIRSVASFDADYEFKSMLGKGGFSTVYLVEDRKTGHEYAAKRFKQTVLAKSRDIIMREVLVMQRLSHPHIVELHDVFQTKSELVLIMEVMMGGELLTRITQKGVYSEKDAATELRAVLDALDYMHSLNIAHCDLKLENLVYRTLESNEIKVIDFGLAHMVGPDARVETQICGTPEYIAPEVLARKGYSSAVDMWSMGVITYILLCGYLPFYGSNAQQVMARVWRGAVEYPPEEWDQISDNGKDFVKRLLEKDVSKRLTAREALNHPFIDVPSESPIPESAVINLKAFSARRKFRTSVLAAMALSTITGRQMRRQLLVATDLQPVHAPRSPRAPGSPKGAITPKGHPSAAKHKAVVFRVPTPRRALVGARTTSMPSAIPAKTVLAPDDQNSAAKPSTPHEVQAPQSAPPMVRFADVPGVHVSPVTPAPDPALTDQASEGRAPADSAAPGGKGGAAEMAEGGGLEEGAVEEVSEEEIEEEVEDVSSQESEEGWDEDGDGAAAETEATDTEGGADTSVDADAAEEDADTELSGDVVDDLLARRLNDVVLTQKQTVVGRKTVRLNPSVSTS